jgi:hypothetical protein
MSKSQTVPTSNVGERTSHDDRKFRPPPRMRDQDSIEKNLVKLPFVVDAKSLALLNQTYPNDKFLSCGTGFPHLHPALAYERRVVEGFAVHWLVKHGYSSLLDAGGAFTRHTHVTQEISIHVARPLLHPADALRSIADTRGLASCPHTLQQCRCQQFDSVLLTHVLYYLQPKDILDCFDRSIRVVVATVHLFDEPFGSYYGGEAIWSPSAPGRYCMTVKGNSQPYEHPNIDWIRTGYYVDGEKAMAWTAIHTGATTITYAFLPCPPRLAFSPPKPLALEEAVSSTSHYGSVFVGNTQVELNACDLSIERFPTSDVYSVGGYFVALSAASVPIVVPKGLLNRAAVFITGQARTPATYAAVLAFVKRDILKMNFPERYAADAVAYTATSAYFRDLDSHATQLDQQISDNVHSIKRYNDSLAFSIVPRVPWRRLLTVSLLVFSILCVPTHYTSERIVKHHWLDEPCSGHCMPVHRSAFSVYMSMFYSAALPLDYVEEFQVFYISAWWLLIVFCFCGLGVAPYVPHRVTREHRRDPRMQAVTVDLEHTIVPSITSDVPLRESVANAVVSGQQYDNLPDSADNTIAIGFVTKYTPIVYTPNFHNELVSTRNRVVQVIPNVDEGFFSRFSACVLDAKIFPITRVQPMDYDVWVSRFPEATQNRLVAALDTPLSYASLMHRSCFIKVERKAVALNQACDDGDPRMIQSCSPQYNNVVGPFMAAFGAAVAKIWHKEFPIYYAYATTSEDLGDWLDHQPDDWHMYMYDASRFDRSITQHMLALERRTYQMAHAPRSVIELTGPHRNKGTTRHGVKFSVDGTRVTGFPGTSVSNSTSNAFSILYCSYQASPLYGTIEFTEFFTSNFSCVVLGDDNVFLTSKLIDENSFCLNMSKLGFVPKLKKCTPVDVEFCSSLYWPVSGRLLLGPKPGRILPKIGWATNPKFNVNTVKGRKSALSQLRSTALGLVQNCNHIPILRAIIRRTIELTTSEKGVSPDAYAYRFHTAIQYQADEYTLAYFCARYSCSISEIDDLEKTILGVRALPAALDHPLIDRVVGVDL